MAFNSKKEITRYFAFIWLVTHENFNNITSLKFSKNAVQRKTAILSEKNQPRRAEFFLEI